MEVLLYLKLELTVDSETAEILKAQSKNSDELAIIVVVGAYRTGKSYFINRTFLKDRSGFDIGNTVNACTKGLVVWPELLTIQSSEEKRHKVLLIDTEGLGSFNESETHDNKIFLLALLISSLLIYNTVGAIDDSALQRLALSINLQKFVSRSLARSTDKSEESTPIVDDDFLDQDCSPYFLWLLRDFSLCLQDPQGAKITSSKYLENALKLASGSSEMTQKKNQVRYVAAQFIRKKISKFFRQRDCKTLVRPSEYESQLQNLAGNEDSLRDEFLTQLEHIKNDIFRHLSPKYIRGRTLNTETFITYLTAFVDALNDDRLPPVQTTWASIMGANAEQEAKRLINDFYIFLQQLQTSVDISVEQFQAKCRANFNKCFPEEFPKKQEICVNLQQNVQKMIDNTLSIVIAQREQKKIEDLNNFLQEIVENEDDRCDHTITRILYALNTLPSDFPVQKQWIKGLIDVFSGLHNKVSSVINENLEHKENLQNEIASLKLSEADLTKSLQIVNTEFAISQEKATIESKAVILNLQQQIHELESELEKTKQQCDSLQRDLLRKETEWQETNNGCETREKTLQTSSIQLNFDREIPHEDQQFKRASWATYDRFLQEEIKLLLKEKEQQRAYIDFLRQEMSYGNPGQMSIGLQLLRPSTPPPKSSKALQSIEIAALSFETMDPRWFIPPTVEVKQISSSQCFGSIRRSLIKEIQVDVEVPASMLTND